MKRTAGNALLVVVFLLLVALPRPVYSQQVTQDPGPQETLVPQDTILKVFLPVLVRQPNISPGPTITPTPSPTPIRTPTRTPTRITPPPGGNNLVINHTNVAQFNNIPDSALPAAINTRVMFRHASVGGNIDLGLDCLWGNYAQRPSTCSSFYDLKYDRHNWDFQIRDTNNPNPFWPEKVTDYINQTNAQINNFDVFSFKFGYVDGFSGSYLISDPVLFQTQFIDRVEALEAAHPDKTFVWWTMSLARVSNTNTQNFNDMLRAYAATHNKILFDLADIESHDPNGNRITDAQGNEVLYQGYTTEVNGGHLNGPGRERVARAFWVLMTRMTGWNGN